MMKDEAGKMLSTCLFIIAFDDPEVSMEIPHIIPFCGIRTVCDVQLLWLWLLKTDRGLNVKDRKSVV